MMDLKQKQHAAWLQKDAQVLQNFVPLAQCDEVTCQPVDLAQVGCVVLAGGMGSRLGIAGPKGCVKIGGQSLFEIMLEKTSDMPLAVMTSPLNHQQTEQALSGSHAELFCQEMLPVLDNEGQWIGDDPLMGPDGNGRLFANLAKAGILERWKQNGIRYLSVMPIDNPKADPKNILQLSALYEAELAVTAIEPLSDDENTGVLGCIGDQLHVAEYSEKKIFGPYRYSGLFACTLDFAIQAARCELPWHMAYKKFENRVCWKFEYFIFDLFQYAKSYKIVYQPRKDCFAPIKETKDLL